MATEALKARTVTALVSTIAPSELSLAPLRVQPAHTSSTHTPHAHLTTSSDSADQNRPYAPEPDSVSSPHAPDGVSGRTLKEYAAVHGRGKRISVMYAIRLSSLVCLAGMLLWKQYSLIHSPSPSHLLGHRL